MKFVQLSENVLSVYLGDEISLEVNQRIIQWVKTLKALQYPGIEAIQHTYHQVGVYFNPDRVEMETIQLLMEKSYMSIQSVDDEKSSSPKIVEIPVVYDGEDLPYIAQQKNISTDDVIRLHSGKLYHTYFLGFSAGFPYLAGVEDAIAVPRLTVPRLKVSAGSVGIAEHQTGIYTVASPGGWQIIGHALPRMFDINRTNPCLVEAGDLIRFVPVKHNTCD